MTSSSGSMPISRHEIEQCQEIVNNFRVNELHLLLSTYQYPKLGKKQELVNKAVQLLNNPKHQLSAVQKIREIQAQNTMRNALQQQYPGQGFSSSSAQQQQQQQQARQPFGTAASYMSTSAAAMMNRAAGGSGFPSYAFGSGGTGYPGTGMHQGLHGAAGYGSGMVGGFQAHSYHQQFQHHTQQQQQQQAPKVGNVRDLKVTDLPFFDKIKVLLPMTEMPAFHGVVRPGEARIQAQFSVPQEDIANLFYRNEDKQAPRLELQLRMFQLDTSAEQADAFPQGCVVKCDDYNVTLPNVIPTNKPNAEQKRLSRPVNLTPYCQPPRGQHRPHRLLIEWTGDRRAWAVTVLLVRRVNSDILLDRVTKNPSNYRSFEKTRDIVIQRLGGDGDEDGIHLTELKVSLLDPLMRTRIKIPSRAAACTHLQCFDLHNYLMMNEKRPVWKCPVCDNPAIYSTLIVDGYYERLLRSVPNKDEVELLRDGSWQVKREVMMDIASDEDDDLVIVPSGKGQSKKGGAESGDKSSTGGRTPSGTSTPAAPETGGGAVEKPPEKEKSAAAPPPPKAPSKKPVSARVDDDDVICLSSDSDDEEEVAPPASVPTSNRQGSSPQAMEISPPTTNENVTTAGRDESPPQQAHYDTRYLQTNGYQPPVFRPIIDQIARQQVAQNLATFLQSVAAKNEVQT